MEYTCDQYKTIPIERGANMSKKSLEDYRYFLKDSIRFEIDFSQTDQHRGIPAPPIQKPSSEDQQRIDLIAKDRWTAIEGIDLITAIARRKSYRVFQSDPLTLEELSFLLWATQGIRKVVPPWTAYRTVPSAGCRHAFETYLCVLNVTGLEQGIYRYLPLEHQLVWERTEEDLGGKLVYGALGQSFLGKAAVTFIWTVVPYRMEWRYGLASHKVIALDAGHAAQNLYLGCEAIGAGTCAIGAYNQREIDHLLRLDGEEEFVIYLAPVGKV